MLDYIILAKSRLANIGRLRVSNPSRCASTERAFHNPANAYLLWRLDTAANVRLLSKTYCEVGNLRILRAAEGVQLA
jgi:hypothetical protein